MDKEHHWEKEWGGSQARPAGVADVEGTRRTERGASEVESFPD